MSNSREAIGAGDLRYEENWSGNTLYVSLFDADDGDHIVLDEEEASLLARKLLRSLEEAVRRRTSATNS